MTISEANKYDTGLLNAVNALLPQLSDNTVPIKETELKEIIASPDSHLLLAEENAELFGIFENAVADI